MSFLILTMSPKNKKINKKTATKVPVNSSSSPFSQFPRIVGPGGVTTPTPASALTIPQVFQEQQQQQALKAHTAAWHAEARQKIINAIATLLQGWLRSSSQHMLWRSLQLRILVGILILMDKWLILSSSCWSYISPLLPNINLTLFIVASIINWNGSSLNGLYKPWQNKKRISFHRCQSIHH